jgi:hypothetical protein
MVWPVIALVFWLAVYGLVGTADIESTADLTAGVDRVEVMAWAK